MNRATRVIKPTLPHLIMSTVNTRFDPLRQYTKEAYFDDWEPANEFLRGLEGGYVFRESEYLRRLPDPRYPARDYCLG